jgi:Tol biopolymer transport system component/tetratricopeptide (TPR) repeat protein
MILSLFVFSCNENEFRGDEFSWSPDGKRLAIVNIDSGELAIIELEGETIKSVTPVDSISGETEYIQTPAWSRDGSYLLYTRSSKMALEIMTCSIAANKRTRIDQIPMDEKKEDKPSVIAVWSPIVNRILWMSWNNQAEYRLFSALPDGKDRTQLLRLSNQEVSPLLASSPDGEWIAYSVRVHKGNKNNGLWKLKPDGSENQQIFRKDEILAVQWQPDGSHLALINKVIVQTNEKQNQSTEIKYHYMLSLIDSDGKNERILAEEDKQLLKCAWSPDGKKLAFFQKQDDVSDAWLVNVDSNHKVRLNFGLVRDFWGWDSASQFFYTTDYPEELGTENKEQKDTRELFESLRGEVKENLLVKCAQFQRRNQNTNISVHTSGGQNGAVAYYKCSKLDILGDETFYPVIEFADGKRIYPARTKNQYVSSADECYLSARYQDALDCFTRYWDIDINTAAFKEKFDADAIIKEIESTDDSKADNKGPGKPAESIVNEMDLLRMVLILRKLNEHEKADWLFEQFKKYTLYSLKKVNNEKGKNEDIDLLTYNIMGIYSRYNELTSALSDLDQFCQSAALDSNVVGSTNYMQSILAIEDKKYESGLQKMESAVKILSPGRIGLDDIEGLLSLCLVHLNENKTALLVPVLQEVIRRFPEDKDVYQMYDMLGDVYQKLNQKEKALAAYQNAVTCNFDNQDIWKKIINNSVR